ncbi:MAG: hypothetical protein JST06_03915 [Bacteroidetes bacterium]|nr:hypothetical protein [Bacteroidota bacterium]MBS1630463.1 hypothetical protein [Bacteroidota bacterium]
MNAAETTQKLWERVRKSGQPLAVLSDILNDYQQALETIAAGDESMRAKLRLQREEIPDLQRLITRKHDTILQGRLQDGIRKLKKVISPEEPPAELPGTESNAETMPDESPTEPKPFRNMPNLGMD